MNMRLQYGLVLALFAAVPLPAASPAPTPTAVSAGAAPHARKLRTHPYSALANAQRALNAAKLFLAKAPEDQAGNRAKAEQAVATALAAVTVEMGAVHGK